MRELTLFLIMSLMLVAARGQQPTPCFTTDVTSGCAPLEVTVTDCSGADPGVILYYYGEGRRSEQARTATSYTYQEPGVYSITQYVGSGAGADSIRLENIITVYEAPEIDFTLEGCPDEGVRITLNDEQYDSYQISFGDGTTETLAPNGTLVHYYGSTQERTVRVRGVYAGAVNNCPHTEAQFTPQPNPATLSIQRIEILSPESIRLTLSDTVDAEGYVLEQQTGNGNFTPLQTLAPGTYSLTLEGLELEAQDYGYRVAQSDPCTGEKTTDAGLRTNYLRASAGNGVLNLNWSPQADPNNTFAFYRIEKNGDSLVALPEVNLTALTDEEVQCQRRYCYRLTAVFEDGRTSTSQEACATAQLSRQLEALNDFQLTLNNASQPVLSWELPQDDLLFRTVFIRTSPTLGRDTVATDAPGTFTDFGANASAEPMCYRISYEDQCGNLAPPSDEQCTIHLSTTTDETSIFHTRTNYEGAPEALSYYLVILDAERNPIDSIPFDGQNLEQLIEEQDQQVIRVRVTATGNTSGATYQSNTVLVTLPSYLHLPNAFSPNGDGLNDTFGGIGKFIEEYELLILTTNGSPVFVSQDIETRWDGTKNGTPVTSGVYFFQLRARDQVGKAYHFKNTITVVR